MIKVGVVGLGMMGQNHARVYTELGCELVGVADSDLERAREIGERCSTRYYADYRELLPQVDAVSIVVPTSLHKEVAEDFLTQGIHCLVEKPIASTIEDAEALVQAAEYANAKLAIGHIERYNPAVTKLKDIIGRGILGDMIALSTRRVGPFVPRIRDVGVIVDSASHDIDIARYIMGREPIGTFARANRFKHPKEEDQAIIVMDFGSTTATIEVNWFTPHKVRSLIVTGSKGTAYLDYIEQTLTICNAEGELNVTIEKAEPLKLELDHFLKCVDNDEDPLVNGHDGLMTLDICLVAAHRQNYILEKATNIAQPVMV
ncbi:MAG: Gfo/Idh/MocA family oxidoreductase [Chloroflexi bacterium]|nr:Gfo/Idh/MocA family oxidoreductase [Chloroflexota bacterium]